MTCATDRSTSSDFDRSSPDDDGDAAEARDACGSVSSVGGGGAWPAQPCSRRTTGGSYGWRVSAYSAAAAAVAHSPAELQRLLHVTSV